MKGKEEASNEPITIVIPTLNEEEAIGSVIDELRGFGRNNILIDGNSDDATRTIASAREDFESLRTSSRSSGSVSGDRYRYYRLSPEEKRALKEAIRSTLEGRGVELAVIFGSFTELESFRDVDVAVYARSSLDLDDAIKLAAELEERTRTPVDVVPLEKASPKLRHHILTKGEVLLEKQPGLYEALLLQTLDELATLEAGNPHPQPTSSPQAEQRNP
ncbi:MAG: hypothetical protein QXJ21_04360 [Thermofilum sp.]